jgi:hypothetical protein
VVSHQVEGKMVKGKNLRPETPFIGEGERDGAEPGPHVGNDEPAERGSMEPWCGNGSPIPSPSRTVRSVFKH